MGRRDEEKSWAQRADVEPEGQDFFFPFKVSLKMTAAELTGQETVVVPLEPESQGTLAEQKETV